MTEFPEEIQVAVARLLDGEYEPSDAGQVVAWLQANPDSRAVLYELFSVDGMLQVNADFDSAAFVASVETRIDSESSDSAFVGGVASVLDDMENEPRSESQHLLMRLLPWVIAVAACAVLIFQTPAPEDGRPVDASVGGGGDGPAEVAVVAPDDGLMALLVNQADAEFADGRSPADVRFSAGTYMLSQGAVHLRFVNGVDMVAQAPAEFEIVSAMSVALADGSLRSLVPEAASGFTVHAPGAAFEDVGTEFGVQVDRETLESQLHVFSGAVKVRTSQNAEAELHRTGESVRVVDGRIEKAPSPEVSLYPTPADLNLLRWEQFRDGLMSQAGVIGYFPFQGSGKQVLENIATESELADGRVIGARWVTGRWPGKSALLFDKPGDRVSLRITDELEQVSLSIWINPDRVDFAHTSLVSSDGNPQGAVHWKIDQTGRTDFAAAGQRWRSVQGPTVPMGRWAHLVAVVDLKAQKIYQYLNGKRISSATINIPYIRLGSCRIGDWLPEEGHPAITRKRGFVGRMGELAIWNRALSDHEVKQLWEGTRPSFHQFD